MRILDEIGVDKSEELAPCQISGIQFAKILVHPSDWTDIIWFAVQDVVVLVSEWMHDKTWDLAEAVCIPSVALVLVGL